MFYLGLDPSLLSFGAVLIDDELNIIKSMILKSSPQKDMEYRLLHLTNNVFNLFSGVVDSSNKNLRIAIEGLSFGSKGQSVAELGALHYFLRILFFDNGLKYQVIPPTTLKKYVCGTGRAKKDLVLLNAYKKFNVSFESSDICDAYCLARFIKEYPRIEEFNDKYKNKKSKKVKADAKK